MSRFNTGNPIGSADPRDRDDNSKNLDEAVNDLNSETWIDRFGVERTTLKLLGDLEDAASAVIGAGDDITLAYQAAIQNDVAFRIPEAAISYTSSLADGGPENRPPLDYEDRSVGSSGLTFRFSAPSLVARRAMINVPVNSDRLLEVAVLTGIRSDQLEDANGTARFCVAWYDASRVRLESPRETLHLETADPISTKSYDIKFTIGSEDNEADVVPPAGAVYAIPYFEFTGNGFDFFASELSISDITEKVKVEQLQEDAIVIAQAAIQNDVAFRIPEAAISYTDSLAEGGPENRPPLSYEDRTTGASGQTFRFTAPNLVARRAMINVPINVSRVIQVSALVGVPPGDVQNGPARFGVAWYSRSRSRLTSLPETIFLETGNDVSPTLEVKFTVGAGGDVEPPSGAIYYIPFFEFTGSDYDFFASGLSVTDVTQELQVAQLQRLGYSGLLSVIDQNIPADVFDFTNAAFAERRPQRGELFPAHRAFIGSGQLSGDVLAVREAGKIMPGQPADIDGRLHYQSDKPLLPELGDFTFFGSTRMDGDQTGNRTLIWQHSGGEPGRVQCVLNGGFTGSRQDTINDGVGIWADGITDGAGLDGTPRKGSAVRGLPVNYVVVMRDGGNASEFWLNGELVDTFTRPPSIAQTTTDLMGRGGSSDQSGRSYGRFGVIHRALDEDEVALVGQWVADAYNDQWERQSLASLSTTDVTTGVLPEAHAAVSYLISPSSAPEKLNQYKELKPLFLRGHQQLLYPASMTKVLTTMVMLDHISDMDMELEMINGDQTGGSGKNIDPGDILTVSDAIYNMMLPSSNVTTSVVARIVGEMLGGSGTGSSSTSRALFVEAMNAKARQLGMKNSNFTNPSGLSNTEMVTTAEDFGRLCANVPNYPDLFGRWGAVDHTLNITGANPRTAEITHSAARVVVDDDYQGGKTGTVGSSPLGSTTRNFMWIGKAPNGNYTANVVMLIVRGDRYEDANGLQNHVFKSLRWPINI